MADKSYFQMFPTIDYDSDDIGNTKVVVDVLKRIRAKTQQLSDKTLFYAYAMKDGETLEDISYQLYGSPKYHWVIMLINSFEDPFYDISLNTQEFESFINTKYGIDQITSDSVTIYDGSAGVNGNIAPHTATTTQFTATENIETKIKVGDSISVVLPYAWYSDTGGSTDPDFIPGIRKLSYTADQTVVSIDTMTKFSTDLQSNTFVRFFANTDIAQETVSVLTNVHHFERDIKDDEGNVLFEKMVTDLEDYSNPATTTTAVSNYTYENDTNDSKRNILLLRPDLLSGFISEFESLMKE